MIRRCCEEYLWPRMHTNEHASERSNVGEQRRRAEEFAAGADLWLELGARDGGEGVFQFFQDFRFRYAWLRCFFVVLPDAGGAELIAEIEEEGLRSFRGSLVCPGFDVRQGGLVSFRSQFQLNLL